MVGTGACAAVLVVILAAPASGASGATGDPYGTLWNILPPGQSGTITATGLLQVLAGDPNRVAVDGTNAPPNFADQLEMYDALNRRDPAQHHHGRHRHATTSATTSRPRPWCAAPSPRPGCRCSGTAMASPTSPARRTTTRCGAPGMPAPRTACSSWTCCATPAAPGWPSSPAPRPDNLADGPGAAALGLLHRGRGPGPDRQRGHPVRRRGAAPDARRRRVHRGHQRRPERDVPGGVPTGTELPGGVRRPRQDPAAAGPGPTSPMSRRWSAASSARAAATSTRTPSGSSRCRRSSVRCKGARSTTTSARRTTPRRPPRPRRGSPTAVARSTRTSRASRCRTSTVRRRRGRARRSTGRPCPPGCRRWCQAARPPTCR